MKLEYTLSVPIYILKYNMCVCVYVHTVHTYIHIYYMLINITVKVFFPQTNLIFHKMHWIHGYLQERVKGGKQWKVCDDVITQMLQAMYGYKL